MQNDEPQVVDPGTVSSVRVVSGEELENLMVKEIREAKHMLQKHEQAFKKNMTCLRDLAFCSTNALHKRIYDSCTETLPTATQSKLVSECLSYLDLSLRYNYPEEDGEIRSQERHSKYLQGYAEELVVHSIHSDLKNTIQPGLIEALTTGKEEFVFYHTVESTGTNRHVRIAVEKKVRAFWKRCFEDLGYEVSVVQVNPTTGTPVAGDVGETVIYPARFTVTWKNTMVDKNKK
jgi:hypothetical protein